jgi:hypothetical protein
MGTLTSFQSIALIISGVVIVATLASAVAHLIEWRTALVWSTLWLAASIAIFRPSITSSIARFLGIGRGADLVFYCGILGMLLGFFFMYVRMKRLEAQITKVVRHIAISENERDVR